MLLAPLLEGLEGLRPDGRGQNLWLYGFAELEALGEARKSLRRTSDRGQNVK